MLQGLVERTRNPVKRAEYEAELECPPFPTSLLYLWNTFNRLRRRKGGGANGPEPISWGDLDAFCRFGGLRLVPWEVEAIEALDDVWLAALKPAPSPSDGES
jgi:hypothetical protein